MQKLLDDNDLLKYLANNEGKTLKGKITLTLTANNSKSYLSCLNKLED